MTPRIAKCLVHPSKKLLNAGLTLSEAVDTIEEQTQNNSFRDILHKVKVDIQGGETMETFRLEREEI